MVYKSKLWNYLCLPVIETGTGIYCVFLEMQLSVLLFAHPQSDFSFFLLVWRSLLPYSFHQQPVEEPEKVSIPSPDGPSEEASPAQPGPAEDPPAPCDEHSEETSPEGLPATDNKRFAAQPIYIAFVLYYSKSVVKKWKHNAEAQAHYK